MKKRKLEKKIKNKYKMTKISRLSIFSIFIMIIILSFSYIRYMKNLVYHNIYQNINELSEQTATQLDLAITNQKNIVKLMAEYINKGHFDEEQEIFEIFKNETKIYQFTRLVILDKKGNGTTSDGFNVNNYPNIEEFFNQEDVYLSENRPSTVSNNQVNIYSKKITLNHEEKILMATINTFDYKQLLLRRLFGKGGTYLITDTGNVLIDSFDNIKDSTANLYDYMKTRYDITDKDNIEKIDKMAYEIKNGMQNTFDIRVDEGIYFINYEKLNNNNWYVVTTASDNTIAEELIKLITLSAIICLIVTFVVICITIYIDISNQKKNNRLYQVAYVDFITSLGNEHFFREKGILYLFEHLTSKKYLITVDINKFKALNNIYGYQFCNEILKQLGYNIKTLLPQDSITCRISNDVFASVFCYKGDINKLLHNISNKASKLEINGINIHLNLAIGACNIIPNNTDINKLLDKAYLARSQIKGLYNNNYYLYDETLDNKMMEEQEIEASMKDALKNKEFEIFYQPKTYVKDEKLYGAEALVRWNRGGQYIHPSKFIPLFEKNKFIIKLDRYIFEKVCIDLANWRDKYGFIPNISINVSKEQFVYENFIDKYVKICNKYNLEPDIIDLEITESATVDSNIDILAVMNRIKEKGFTISIDDFGTGNSSLSMLQNMPIDIIKIDKTFVDKADLTSDENIINYIMLMAKHLNTKTIIEGVETKEQVEFIKRIGGDIIQGYYYSKPISRREFESYFKKNK